MFDNLKIRKTLLQGLLVLAPLYITIWIITLVVKKLANLSKPFIAPLFAKWHIPFQPLVIYGISFFITLGVVYLLGKVAGKPVSLAVDRFMNRIPIARTLYTAIQRVIFTFSSPAKVSHRETVILEYPKKGIWTLGFVTNRFGPYLALFIPTTPNPTSGWFVVVHKDRCIPTTLTLDDAMKIIISAGIIAPENFNPPTLLPPHDASSENS